MKKFLNILLIAVLMLMNVQLAYAKTSKASAVVYVSPKIKRANMVTMQLMEPICLSDTEVVQANAYIGTEIVKKVEAKRGKQNEYYNVKIIAYSVPDMDNKIEHVEAKEIYGKIKVYSKIDAKKVVGTVATTVASTKIPFVSQGIAVVKGVVKPRENKSVAESVGINLYESTPLVYLEKGQKLNLTNKTVVLLEVQYDDEL